MIAKFCFAKLLCGSGLLGLLAIVNAAGVWAEDPTDAERATVLKTQERLHFELPPDWPIEKRGGIVAPIPVEEYLAKKFKALEGRLQQIEQQLNGLDVRLRVVEEAQKTPPPGLRSSERQEP